MSGIVSGTYPRHTEQFSALAQVIEDTVLPDYLPASPFFGLDRGVVTVGSCFAVNLAEALHRKGALAAPFTFSEAINSPLSNRWLFEYTANPTKPFVTPEHERFFNRKVCQQFAESLAFAELLVITLGLSYTWFLQSGSVPIFDPKDPSLAEQRYQNVAENESAIAFMVESALAINPALKIVLTVSPVPLNRIFGRRSAVAADCLSKSTLRVSVDQYLQRGIPNVHYWPSFEIVRWLGAHLPPVYGADDGLTRHVNRDLVDLIVALFIKYYCRPTEAA